MEVLEVPWRLLKGNARPDPEVPNKYNHRYSPRIELGATGRVTRMIDHNGKVSYGFGETLPLKLQDIVPLLTWRTFLENHLADLASMDFFTVPTAPFRTLYVFIVLRHDRREIVNFNVAEYPTARWKAQQIVEAFPFYTPPRYLVRNRDRIYGVAVQRRIKSLAIEGVLTAPRSPWQNRFVERMIGSIRRDCLDHVIVLNERHLRRILREYFGYYPTCRTHLSLSKDSPQPRTVELPDLGKVTAFPFMGGLHHRYGRLAV